MKYLIFLLLMVNNVCLAGPYFDCLVKKNYDVTDDGALAVSVLSDYVVGKKFIVNRNSGHISGCCGMRTPAHNLVLLKVISYGDSNNNFKSIAVWEDQTQQITIKTITGFSGESAAEEKPFTALSSGRVLTGLCEEGYQS